MGRSLLFALVCAVICPRVSAQEVTELESEITRARSIFEQALAAYEAGDPDEYEKLLANAVETVVSAPGAGLDTEAAELLTEFGDHALATHYTEQAHRIFEWLEDYCERQFEPDHPSALLILQRLAVAKRDLGDLEGARDLQQRVLDVYERTQSLDSFELAAARANLGGTLADLGDLTGALALEEAALTVFERSLPSDDVNLLAVRGNLAFHKLELGDYEGALELQREVVAALEDGFQEDPLQLGWAFVRLGAIEQEMGRFEDARDSMERGLAQLRGNLPADHLMLASARANLAGSLADLGDLAAARALQRQALTVYADQLEPDDWELVAAKQGLAYLFARTGEHERALALREEVVDQYARLLPPEHPDLLNARHDLALSCLETDDDGRAVELLTSAIEAASETLTDDDPDLVAARLSLADAHEASGDFETAGQVLVSAMATGARDLAPTDPDLAVARTELASLMVRAGQPDKARPLIAQAVDVLDRTLPEDDPDRLAAHVLKVRILHDLGLEDPARAAFSTLLGLWVDALAGRVVYAHPTRPYEELDREIESLLLDADARWDLSARERLRLFEALETHRYVATGAPIRRRPNAEIAGLRVKALEARDQLERLSRTVGAVNEELRKRLVATFEESDKAIRQRLTATGTSMARVSPETVSSKLAENEVAIGFRRYSRFVDEEDGPTTEERFLALLITPSRTFQRIELGRVQRVEQLVTRWRAAAGRPLSGSGDEAPTLEEAGTELRERLLDPILKRLGDHVERWIVLPDGALHLVPFEALPLEGGAFVADRFELSYELSFAAVISPPPPARNPSQWVGVGGPRFDAEVVEAAGGPRGPTPLVEASFTTEDSARVFAPLEEGVGEVEAIAKIFEAAFGESPTVLTRGQASKEELRAVASSARWIHLATRDYLAPQSVDRKSGLLPGTLVGWALAGANRGRDFTGRVPGILTAEELRNLDLDQCDLLLLSECETNSGAEHASFGWENMLAALHGAGVRTTVTTLWEVEDEAKANFLRSFYRRLWSDGEPKVTAFRSAVRALRATGAPVADWAGWRLVGGRR